MEIFDYQDVCIDVIDVALEMNDGKVLFFSDVKYDRYDNSIDVKHLMDYYCMSADWDPIEYHPTVSEITDARIAITNFLDKRYEE